MEYDFSVLNDRDFEILANDLLSKHFQSRIERFKPGKDKGVDGRWHSISDGEVIVQYKNWGRSGVEKLISHLASSELEKIKGLSPSRYILATSVPLSRVNKQKIAAILAPYIQSQADIFGREDLHDLLVRSPEIEARNPKLWVATGRVLSQIFNNGLVGRSGFAIEEIQGFARRYVETKEAARARAMLDSTGVLIIKGEPGVGKTTLAHEMLLEALGCGYAGYVIDSVEEAEAVFDDETSQFFFFDDFLGGNFLEAIRGREDARVVALMRRVAAKKNKKLVLTSRTHILEQGKDCSELFRIEKIAAREFELSVGYLTLMERARILYSHIWAGGMPSEAIESIYDSRRYLTVIKHRNFNPRLISFITDPDRVQALNKDQYWNYVTDAFENPSGIWEHVFRKQINPDTKDIAYLVGYNGRPIGEQDLKDAFRIYSSRDSESEATHSQRFHDALKLAVGSVVNRVIDSDGRVAISLFNPSIADYLLAQGPVFGILTSLFRAVRTVAALNFLDSLVTRGVVSAEQQISILSANANDVILSGRADSAIALELAARLIKADVDWSDISSTCMAVAHSLDGAVDSSVENALLLMLTTLERSGDVSLLPIVDRLLEDATELMVSNNAMRMICGLAKLADGIDEGVRFLAVSDAVISLWRENIGQFASDDMILADVYDENDAWFAESQLHDYVLMELESMGIDVAPEVVAEIAAEVDVRDVIAKNQESAAESWHEDHRVESTYLSPDAEIEDYFDRTH